MPTVPPVVTQKEMPQAANHALLDAQPAHLPLSAILVMSDTDSLLILLVKNAPLILSQLEELPPVTHAPTEHSRMLVLILASTAPLAVPNALTLPLARVACLGMAMTLVPILVLNAQPESSPLELLTLAPHALTQPSLRLEQIAALTAPMVVPNVLTPLLVKVACLDMV